MTTIILIIIYLAFISLGLPDSILGVSLPSMIDEWNIGLSVGGLIAMVITIGTIISSFASGYVIKKLGTARTTLISCLMTSGALFGMASAPDWYWLLFLAVPLGLGAGSVDTALNNYVALNYRAHHMNWLHSFWGVGATAGPLIISFNLARHGWRTGYSTIAAVQLGIAVLFLLSLPIWLKKGEGDTDGDGEQGANSPAILKTKGALASMAVMLFYCAVETSVGLWGSSFLISAESLSPQKAASWMSLYYGGITAGRVLSGFASFRMSNKNLIRTGLAVSFSAVVLLMLPLPSYVSGAAMILTGLGLAPVFPAMIHEAPIRFGKERSRIIIGFQMGSAYIGIAMFPPLFGLIFQHSSAALLPYAAFAITAVLIIITEYLAAVFKAGTGESKKQNQ